MSLKPYSTVPHLHSHKLLAMAIAAALGSGPLVAAAVSPQAIKITAVQISFDALPNPGGDFMTIMGTNFLNGGTPVVTLGKNINLPPKSATTATKIEVFCPAVSGVPTCPVGDFLLTVKTRPGNDNKTTATYDLTIGAVGPKGDMGKVGPVGPIGPQGLPGVQGVSSNMV